MWVSKIILVQPCSHLTQKNLALVVERELAQNPARDQSSGQPLLLPSSPVSVRGSLVVTAGSTQEVHRESHILQGML